MLDRPTIDGDIDRIEYLYVTRSETIFNIYVDITLHIIRLLSNVVTMGSRNDRIGALHAYATVQVTVEFGIFPVTMGDDS